jgi:hypothetical protein
MSMASTRPTRGPPAAAHDDSSDSTSLQAQAATVRHSRRAALSVLGHTSLLARGQHAPNYAQHTGCQAAAKAVHSTLPAGILLLVLRLLLECEPGMLQVLGCVLFVGQLLTRGTSSCSTGEHTEQVQLLHLKRLLCHSHPAAPCPF